MYNLPKVVYFSSDVHGNFSGNAMPNFIPDSNSPIIRLSNDVSFIPVSCLKHGEKSHDMKLGLRWGGKLNAGSVVSIYHPSKKDQWWHKVFKIGVEVSSMMLA